MKMYILERRNNYFVLMHVHKMVNVMLVCYKKINEALDTNAAIKFKLKSFRKWTGQQADKRLHILNFAVR